MLKKWISSASAASRLLVPLRQCTLLSVRLSSHKTSAQEMHGTTILAVRKGGQVVVIGDGQVSLGGTVVKSTAKKVRLLSNGKVIAGFAGSTADALTLLDRLEKKLEEHGDQLLRASVEMAKLWRTDKYLRHLEAWMIAVDKDISLQLTGSGDVLSAPADGVIAIGSGGNYAMSAARALVDIPGLTAEEVAKKAMGIAADICVYTNRNWTMEKFDNARPNELELEKQQQAPQDTTSPAPSHTPSPAPAPGPQRDTDPAKPKPGDVDRSDKTPTREGDTPRDVRDDGSRAPRPDRDFSRPSRDDLPGRQDSNRPQS